MDASRWAKRATSIAGLLTAWFLLAAVGPELLPGPAATAASFAEQVQQSSYWDAVVASTVRVWMAFVIAAVLAVPIGLLIGWNAMVGDFVFPPLELLRSIPPIAWIAFTILVVPTATLGLPVIGIIEVENIVFIAFLGAFFPILLNTIEGVRGIDEEFSRAAASLGAASWQTFRHVIYPGALPSIHTGMIVGMGLAWVNLVAAEMTGVGGLGFLTWSAFTGGSYPVIIVGMVSIGALGYLSSAIVRRAGISQIPWQETQAA